MRLLPELAGQDGVYWLNPQGIDPSTAFQAYCDMTDDNDDGGGGTRLMSAHWPYLFPATQRERVGLPVDGQGHPYPNISILAERSRFTRPHEFPAPAGLIGDAYEFRLEVGEEGTWNTGPRTHHTIWWQGHDPCIARSNGSDFDGLRGDVPPVPDGCGAQQHGLHQWKYGGATWALVDVADSDDDAQACSGVWQIIPRSPENPDGYREWYQARSTSHQWQSLWVR